MAVALRLPHARHGALTARLVRANHRYSVSYTRVNQVNTVSLLQYYLQRHSPCFVAQKEINMRSFVLSLGFALGALGASLAAASQARADEYRGPAAGSATLPVAQHWRGGRYGGGRAFYPGYGYGYSRGYYPSGGYGRYGAYPYGAYGGYGIYNRSYYPGAYNQGYYPWGNRYGIGGYSNYYLRPGFFW